MKTIWIFFLIVYTPCITSKYSLFFILLLRYIVDVNWYCNTMDAKEGLESDYHFLQ